jgi:hypothetical protein
LKLYIKDDKILDINIHIKIMGYVIPSYTSSSLCEIWYNEIPNYTGDIAYSTHIVEFIKQQNEIEKFMFIEYLQNEQLQNYNIDEDELIDNLIKFKSPKEICLSALIAKGYTVIDE